MHGLFYISDAFYIRIPYQFIHFHSCCLKLLLFEVFVPETWLVPSVSSSFVAVDGFQVVSGDGSDSFKNHGCCLYVADSLSFVSVEVDLLNVAVVFFIDLNVYVVVYRPPSYTALQDESLLLFLSEFCIGREVLLLGD